MTLRDILQDRPTLDQYAILERADRLFADRCGRYYGGPITGSERDILDPPKSAKA